MPLYMDIHRQIADSPEDVQSAHMNDLDAQDQYGVEYLKYWHNPQQRTVCCLVRAPNPEAAEAVHLEAHGLAADKIIEVDEQVVEAFLGDGFDAGYGRMVLADGDPDGALRTILFTDIVDSTARTHELGDDAAVRIVKIHDQIVRREVQQRGGRCVKHTGDGMMCAFRDATTAIQSAIAIQRALADQNPSPNDPPISVRIGMSAGEPVDEGHDLFGAAVNLARRVCDAADGGAIYVANVVHELCIGKPIEFTDVGDTELKGFPRPVRLYQVVSS